MELAHLHKKQIAHGIRLSGKAANTKSKTKGGQQPTIIKVRNFEKLADVRQHWLWEVKHGKVVLVREFDQMPDMSKMEETKRIIESMLKSYRK